MVRKNYQLTEGKVLSLVYNQRKKYLSILVNEKEINSINDIHGYFGSISMCSEDALCKTIDVSVEGIPNRLQVFFNRSEMYTHAELFIDGKSAENQHTMLPSTNHAAGTLMWHILIWILYFVGIILMIAFIIFTMLIGLVIVIVVVIVYEIYWKIANSKEYSFNAKTIVSLFQLEHIV